MESHIQLNENEEVQNILKCSSSPQKKPNNFNFHICASILIATITHYVSSEGVRTGWSPKRHSETITEESSGTAQ